MESTAQAYEAAVLCTPVNHNQSTQAAVSCMLCTAVHKVLLAAAAPVLLLAVSGVSVLMLC
jgi:hypothetical protein